MKRKADETAVQDGGGPADTEPAGPESKKRRRSKTEDRTESITANEKTQVTDLAAEAKEGAKSNRGGGEANGTAAATELLKKKRNRKKTKPAAAAAAAAGDSNDGDKPEPNVGEEEDGGATKRRKTKKDTKAKTRTGSSSQPLEGEGGEETGKKHRFIVFIGNLPFTATTESLRAHLAALQPSSIRLLTHRDDATKTRGIAFVEFDSYGPMTACLERYHHSEFDDGISPPRKINVELTAGGGGGKSHRREKIKAKNEKLRAERAKRVKAEEEQRVGRRKDNEGKAKPEGDQDGKAGGGGGGGGGGGDDDEHGGVHPSRREQVGRGRGGHTGRRGGQRGRGRGRGGRGGRGGRR